MRFRGSLKIVMKVLAQYFVFGFSSPTCFILLNKVNINSQVRISLLDQTKINHYLAVSLMTGILVDL